MLEFIRLNNEEWILNFLSEEEILEPRNDDPDMWEAELDRLVELAESRLEIRDTMIALYRTGAL